MTIFITYPKRDKRVVEILQESLHPLNCEVKCYEQEEIVESGTGEQQGQRVNQETIKQVMSGCDACFVSPVDHVERVVELNEVIVKCQICLLIVSPASPMDVFKPWLITIASISNDADIPTALFEIDCSVDMRIPDINVTTTLDQTELGSAIQKTVVDVS